MKNFLTGLLLGVLVTYWYLHQSDHTRNLVSDWWARASSAPASSRAKR